MNLALFFEGTGQGVVGKRTNVTRLYEMCEENSSQRLHLESGPGTHFGSYFAGRVAGVDWRTIFRRARRWFEANYKSLPDDGIDTKVFLFGFSRGASIARHFSFWLDKLGVQVEYLGVWDTVDATPGLVVPQKLSPNVKKARHAIARDETRKFFSVVPLDGAEQMVFPGVHSDVGGGYTDNHVIADVALAWVARPAKCAGMRLKKSVRLVQKCNAADIAVHDERKNASNLWGMFDPVRRSLSGIRQHAIARLVKRISK